MKLDVTDKDRRAKLKVTADNKHINKENRRQKK